jgi:2-polyprenyl-3-methyl-5-hydroxy-6-metoxy-1,4-benzoquinol methylase
MLRAALVSRGLSKNAHLLDVGCGTGALFPYIQDLCERYDGADVVRYPEFPSHLTFHGINLDAQRIEIADASMDAAVAVETIEHLENPRALVRELARAIKPGGIVAVTTPNNLSLLSKLTLLLKNQFNAFQEPCYPAHITALVEIDLIRMMNETGLKDARALYSNHGRVVGTPWHWPARIFNGRAFSDNVLVSAVKPR